MSNKKNFSTLQEEELKTENSIEVKIEETNANLKKTINKNKFYSYELNCFCF